MRAPLILTSCLPLLLATSGPGCRKPPSSSGSGSPDSGAATDSGSGEGVGEDTADSGDTGSCMGSGCRLEGELGPGSWGARWSGAAEDHEAGLSLCGADLDGDGLDEVVIGAPSADGAAGRVYLGQAGGGSLTEAPAEWLAEAAGDQAGRALACPGDLDGDGFEEVLLGQRGSDAGAEDAGGLVVIWGPVEGGQAQLADLGQVVSSSWAGELAGSTLVGGWDHSGDGVADLAVGAPTSTRGGVASGAVLLLAGPLDAVGDLDTPHAVLSSTNPDDFVGLALDSAGDVDGDGVADLVVGGWGNDSNGAFAGAAWLVLGPIEGDQDLADSERRWRGPGDWALLGYAVAGGGDLDGDGLDDLVLAAPGEHVLETTEGRVYVLADPVASTLDDALAVLSGPSVGAHAGWSLAADLDLDGDAQGDLAVGMPDLSTVASQAGGVGVLYGPLDGAYGLANAPLLLLEEEASAQAGFSLAGGGDLDGDGLEDLLLGIPRSGSSGGRAPGAVASIRGVRD